MTQILHLNLHRKFFADIAAGDKRIEYRDQTPYWRKRLEGRHYDIIKFRNGYSTKAPEMLVEFRGLRRLGTGRKARYAFVLVEFGGLGVGHKYASDYREEVIRNNIVESGSSTIGSRDWRVTMNDDRAVEASGVNCPRDRPSSRP